MNVYDMLVDELLEAIYIDEDTASSVVEYLANSGFIDYDVLKETYLDG